MEQKKKKRKLSSRQVQIGQRREEREESDANQIFCRWSYNRRNEQRLRDFLSPLGDEQKNEGIGEITALSLDILEQTAPWSCQYLLDMYLIHFHHFIWSSFVFTSFSNNL